MANVFHTALHPLNGGSGVRVGSQHHLLDAVRRLPPRLSVVVLLHYYADLSVDEVARTLRRPAGSVKRQLSEARAVLAHTLGDQP